MQATLLYFPSKTAQTGLGWSSANASTPIILARLSPPICIYTAKAVEVDGDEIVGWVTLQISNAYF